MSVQLIQKLHEQIRSLSISQLEELGEALLDFSALSDLRAWLESPGKLIDD